MKNVVKRKWLTDIVLATVMSQLIMPLHAYAAITTLPPLAKSGVYPNIFYTLDDSGSMQWDMMPDDLDGKGYDEYCNGCWVTQTFPKPSGVYNNSGSDYNSQNRISVGFNNNITVAKYRSAAVNKIYYDPNITYLPWIGSDGNRMTKANINAALYNPIAPSGGSNATTIDLTKNATISYSWLNDAGNGYGNGNLTFFPALYYVYNGGAGCNFSTLSCYTRYEIKSGTNFPKPATRTDCTSSTTNCVYAEEIQNFANWFQYYRSRILVARGGSGAAFATQPLGIRVGFGTINTSGTVINRVSDDFGTSAKTSFLNTLYTYNMPAAGTPLRKSLDEVGQYFKDTSSSGPWQNKAGDSSSGQASCRQNYNILMTDGYWNGAGAGSPRNGNVDNTSSTTITASDGTTYKYTPTGPYKDGYSDTLADVAFYYWVNDLRPDWSDKKYKNVPASSKDPAFWQHLVNFTVGLGVNGSIDVKDTATMKQLTDGTLSWPDAASNQIDDLAHAAVNSRGDFFSASNPVEFANALSSTLSQISDRVGDSAALGTSTNTIRSGTALYSSTYRTADWSGQVSKIKLNTDGSVGDLAWTASMTPGSRKVFSSYKGNGIEFKLENYSTTDKKPYTDKATALGVTEAQLFSFLMGNPDTTDKLRKRTQAFGDFVNSAPQFLKEGDNQGYIFLPSTMDAAKKSYPKYLIDKLTTRPGMVYIGGNDGMLHAFSDSDGKEAFAYVPKAIFSKLPELADPKYAHQFYVDGTPNFGDVYLSGAWKTVLAGATGAGGRGVYVLDVSNPSAPFSTGNVLADISSADDADIGYTIGVPQIGIAPNGDPVVVFGNGYESQSYKSVLFIYNLSKKTLTKVDTGVGSASAQNGLATPRLVFNKDATIRAAYAGDLQGNLWRFDFASDGSVKLGSSTPIFTAKYGTTVQPITVQPDVTSHPLGGTMVLFGTGAIFRDGDAASTSKQSLYGIWDKKVAVSGKTSLQQQTVTYDKGFYKVSSNLVDWKTKLGWYIDLDIAEASGERVILDPQVVYEQIVFTTTQPGSSTDPCATDGQSSIFQLDALSGRMLNYPVFDTNGDKTITSTDTVYGAQKRELTFGTTILKKGNTVVFYHPKATSNSASDPKNVSKSDQKPIEDRRTTLYWRQILGKD